MGGHDDLVRVALSRLKRIKAIIGLEIDKLERAAGTDPPPPRVVHRRRPLPPSDPSLPSAPPRQRGERKTWSHPNGVLTISQAIAKALEPGPRTKAQILAELTAMMEAGKMWCRSITSVDGLLSKGRGTMWQKRGHGEFSLWWLNGTPEPAPQTRVDRPAPRRAVPQVAESERNEAVRDAIDAGTREPLTLDEAIGHVLSGDVGEGLDASAIATACHALDRLGMLADGIVIDTPHVHEILYAQEERRYTRGHVLGVRARWRIMDAEPAVAGTAK